MICFRTFRNTDPPQLAEIWRSSAQDDGLFPAMTTTLLEDLVLCKPYFDPAGLIVADEDGRPVGFVHAGFGPTPDGSSLDTQVGIVCMVVVRGTHRGEGVGRELVSRAEQFLRERGARVLYGGGFRALSPFHMGLYGSSELPGVLAANVAAQRLYESLGYRVVDHTLSLRLALADFQPAVSRQQRLVRRTMRLVSALDPPPPNWWAACTTGEFHRLRIELVPITGGEAWGHAMFWSFDPISCRGGTRAAGLTDVRIAAEHRRQGLATFLLGGAFRHLADDQFTHIHAQTMESDAAARGLFAKLGFEEIARGSVYCKD